MTDQRHPTTDPRAEPVFWVCGVRFPRRDADWLRDVVEGAYGVFLNMHTFSNRVEDASCLTLEAVDAAIADVRRRVHEYVPPRIAALLDPPYGVSLSVRTEPAPAPHWSERLARLGACEEALDWCKSQPSPEAAWDACPRGDWLIWIAARVVPNRRLVVGVACQCVRDAVEFGYQMRLALGVVGAWAWGEVTAVEVGRAGFAAKRSEAVASTAVYCLAEAVTEYRPERAADLVGVALNTAAYAGDAPYDDALRRCADYVREHITRPEWPEE